MDCTSRRLSYRQTNYFSKIILDYLEGAESLRPFYVHTPSLEGIQQAIRNRKEVQTNRKVLVEELRNQYSNVTANDATNRNIERLLAENSFTITTAHQPNIFTGPLYFLYKILHTLKLAAFCKTSLPQYDFVPVFYMGSEDADLAELGHFYLNGEKLSWNTKQTGAVGRMKIDDQFLKLVQQSEGQLAVLPFGNEIISTIKSCYRKGMQLQDATFELIHSLFADFGLVVLIPDNVALKKQALAIFEDDLVNERPSAIVEQTAAKLRDAGYKVQANPREINLFYLEDSLRERIVRKDAVFRIQNSELKFSQDELLKELNAHPERFSPNVILRGIYQETILPNLVYIGGGGEIAYWLQLKDLFEYYKVPFPVLLLRNSFLLLERKWKDKIGKLGFTVEDFFLPGQQLVNKLVTRDSKNEIKLNGNFSETEKLYATLREQAMAIDTTLAQHVEALKTQSIYRLQELEKKMLRAEKRKFADQQRQIQSIRETLFPRNGLQERIDNFMYYYAKWGNDFIKQAYKYSLALEQEFVILSEQ